ncbi:MAG: GNAT family N-acetyltransferase [Pelagimonas sp.]|nr:GNAT family N-acetyltransferase [Pelagimonas sp.]
MEQAFQLRHALDTEGPALADLRVAAMRPSLEAVGRFDPTRARARFLSGFTPQNTHVIAHGDELMGFFVLRETETDIWLDHLYVSPKTQGAGVGRFVMDYVQKQARGAGKPVRLMALIGSAANGFYQSHGFEETHREEFDIFYIWVPK